MCQINNLIRVCNRKLTNFYELAVIEGLKTNPPSLINEKDKLKVLR